MLKIPGGEPTRTASTVWRRETLFLSRWEPTMTRKSRVPEVKLALAANPTSPIRRGLKRNRNMLHDRSTALPKSCTLPTCSLQYPFHPPRPRLMVQLNFNTPLTSAPHWLRRTSCRPKFVDPPSPLTFCPADYIHGGGHPMYELCEYGTG